MDLKISVALAAFHGEKYIAEQLKSLFDQTRCIHEIVIGDDSRDNLTEKVIRDVVARENWKGTLKYIHNDVRLGVEKNFLNIAAHTTGDIIFLCDQDDVWFPDKVSVLSEILEHHPHLQVVACCSQMTDRFLKIIPRTIPENILGMESIFSDINQGKSFQYLIQQKIRILGHAMAMKRSILPLFLKMPPELPYHDVWLSLCASLSETLWYSNRILTYYRVHESNVSSPMKRNSKRIGDRLAEVIADDDDLQKTFIMYSTLADLVTQFNIPCPIENRYFLQKNIHYFATRIKLRKHYILFRFLFLRRDLLLDYFRIGTGWRALLRDLIL